MSFRYAKKCHIASLTVRKGLILLPTFDAGKFKSFGVFNNRNFIMTRD